MTPVLQRGLGGVVAVGATVLLAALSRAPQPVGDGHGGLLRLSWSGQPERVEVCRTMPDEELAALPQHMRQPVVCEGRAADYHLVVTVDGAVVTDEPVTGGGLRHDRPVYLYREFPLSPGAHALTVRFALADTAAPAPARAAPGRLDALPRVLTLDTAITLRPRTVALVTYDAEGSKLGMQQGQ